MDRMIKQLIGRSAGATTICTYRATNSLFRDLFCNEFSIIGGEYKKKQYAFYFRYYIWVLPI